MKPFLHAPSSDMGLTIDGCNTFWEKAMKTALLALGLCVMAVDAQAISRYDPTRMSCDQVQATIAQQGAVILRYQSARTPGLPLYDRYVDSGGFCERGEIAYPATVPTADTKSCPVYLCKVPDLDDRDRFLFP
jgi:hypothetical protein